MSLFEKLFGYENPFDTPGYGYGSYYFPWLAAHDRSKQEPGCWAGKVWVTDTPEWDADWFRSHGFRVPRMGHHSEAHWKDYGGGLHGLEY